MVRAASEVGLKTKLFGGGMVGAAEHLDQGAARAVAERHCRLRFLATVVQVASPESLAFLKKYQDAAPSMASTRLAITCRPSRMAICRCCSRRSRPAKSLDDDKYAAALRAGTFKTIVGDVKFGPNGEWSEPRVLTVQFQKSNPTTWSSSATRRPR